MSLRTFRVLGGIVFLSLPLVFAGCGSGSDGTSQPAADGDTTDVVEADTLPADGDSVDTIDPDAEVAEGTYSDPWTVMPTSELPKIRGQRIVRGVIHNHSPYSHDGCDNAPRVALPDGDAEYDVYDTVIGADGMSRNEPCFLDVREGMCKNALDFVMMSDHPTHFAEYEFPEVLLRAEGDTLVVHDGLPTANRVKCANSSHEVLMLAGTEGTMMQLGFERHVSGDIDTRKSVYSPNHGDVAGLIDTIDKTKAVGALAWIMHTEDWTADELKALPIDGIESYNIHANMILMNKSVLLKLIYNASYKPEILPIPELLIMAIFEETPIYLSSWASVAQVKHIGTTFATDAHRNVAPGKLGDGDRLDSFRRLMHWFSNYVLIPDGDFDDRTVKTYVKKGRMYNAWDYLGYPVGFDFHGEVGATVYEMGDIAPKDASVTLKLVLPTVYKLDPRLQAPVITGKLYKANGDQWDEVTTTKDESGALTATVGNGVYRAAVYIMPNHLAPYMNNSAAEYLKEKPWIYSNAIWVGDPEATKK